MYMLREQLELGLYPGQEWPSEAHEHVAMVICLNNPMIYTRDALTDLVQKVINIPVDKIKHVTLGDLIKYDINLMPS